MKAKCIKNSISPVAYADIEKDVEYQIYDIRQNTTNKEYLIKDKSKKKKWYEEELFEVIK